MPKNCIYVLPKGSTEDRPASTLFRLKNFHLKGLIEKKKKKTTEFTSKVIRTEILSWLRPLSNSYVVMCHTEYVSRTETLLSPRVKERGLFSVSRPF